MKLPIADHYLVNHVWERIAWDRLYALWIQQVGPNYCEIFL